VESDSDPATEIARALPADDLDVTRLVEADARHQTGSSRQPYEVGAWSLDYLGPGFRVQVRVVRRGGRAGLDGFLSSARPTTVVLTHLETRATLETRASFSGRFEFLALPPGASQLTIVEDSGMAATTPPFWV